MYFFVLGDICQIILSRLQRRSRSEAMMLIDIISDLGGSLGWAKCFKDELTHFGEYSSKNIAYRTLLSEKVVRPQHL